MYPHYHLHPPPRAIPAVDVRAHYTLPGGLFIVVVVHQRRHRPPPPPSSPSRGWLLLGAACRHLHPHHYRPPLPQVTPPTTASPPPHLILLPPPCDPPPVDVALSPPSQSPITHGAVMDWHAASTPSLPVQRGKCRSRMHPSSGYGPIAPAPPSRLPQCLGLLSGGRR
jgi:hypothetical protein